MKRKASIDLTSSEFVWLMGSVLALGILVGWAIASPPTPLKKAMEFGNVAEWVAAIGTIAIGYGAWKYARESYFYRVDEVESAKEHDSAVLINKLRRLAAIAGYGKFMSANIEVFEAAPAAHQTQFIWHSSLKRSLRDAGRIDLRSFEFAIDHEHAAVFQFFEVRLHSYIESAETALEALGTSAPMLPLTPTHRLQFDAVKDNANDLAQRADDLFNVLLGQMIAARYTRPD